MAKITITADSKMKEIAINTKNEDDIYPSNEQIEAWAKEAEENKIDTTGYPPLEEDELD